MSDELVKALAQRFVYVFMESIGGVEGKTTLFGPGGEIEFSASHGPDQFPDMHSIDFSPMARECLRQMEWARRPTYATHPGGTIYLVDNPPLTLAPDDWQP